jgi:uncharacterized protein (DUF58 family)
VLTRQGWLVAWGGLCLVVLARLFGIGELYVLGAVMLGLVVLTVLRVRTTRLDLHVDRVVHPARVHADQLSRVEIRVRNLRVRPTPVLRLREAVTGTAGADLLLPPLDPGAASVASYRLPTSRRGIVHVGPLRVVVTDPLGLSQASVEAAPRVDVTVLPRIDDVEPTPLTTGHDPLSGALQLHALGRAGDDFYALRSYVVGDDLRRIHWPSTARHDELLVRQQEQPWQGRTTVLLDVRRVAHDPDSLEDAVSAAASVLAVAGARRDLVRLVTTDGADSGYGSGTTHLHALLEHLAVVTASGAASLRTMLDLVQRDGQGVLVIVAGRTAADDLRAVEQLRMRFGLVTVVRVGEPSAGPRGRATTNGSAVTVICGNGTPFAEAWNQAMATMARTPRVLSRSGGP